MEDGDENMMDNDPFGEGDRPLPPLPDADMESQINSTIQTAEQFNSIKEMKGWISHANIGVEISDLTDKEKRDLEIYVAKKIKLWLNLRGKRRFLRKTFGTVSYKRGEISKGQMAKMERKKEMQHDMAKDVLDEFQYNRLTERKIVYDQFYDAIGNDSLIVTRGNIAESQGLYNKGLAQRMFTVHYGMTPENFDSRKQQAFEHFESKYGLPFKDHGTESEDSDEATGTLYLYPKGNTYAKPYAKVENYLFNPRSKTKITSATSTIGSGLKSKHVSEAGWMVTLLSDVSLEGDYNKLAKAGSIMIFSDLFIPTDGTSCLGDEAEVGSPISVHIESESPSVVSNGGLDHNIELKTTRIFSNGETYGISVKSGSRNISVVDDIINVKSSYTI